MYITTVSKLWNISFMRILNLNNLATYFVDIYKFFRGYMRPWYLRAMTRSKVEAFTNKTLWQDIIINDTTYLVMWLVPVFLKKGHLLYLMTFILSLCHFQSQAMICHNWVFWQILPSFKFTALEKPE